MSKVPNEFLAYALTKGFVNVAPAAIACREVGLPFYAALALLEMESHGHNVWGHDAKRDASGNVTEWGVFSGFPDDVTPEAFDAFCYEVLNHGKLSNGVGPCQITYAGSVQPDGTRPGGFFAEAEDQGLDLSAPLDNMRFGFAKMAGYFAKYGDWRKAGRLYNGKDSYGVTFARRVEKWHTALKAL